SRNGKTKQGKRVHRPFRVADIPAAIADARDPALPNRAARRAERHARHGWHEPAHGQRCREERDESGKIDAGGKRDEPGGMPLHAASRASVIDASTWPAPSARSTVISLTLTP